MSNLPNSLTTVLLADKKGRGYSGYFVEYPDLTAQGIDKDEVEYNLRVSLSDIIEHDHNNVT